MADKKRITPTQFVNPWDETNMIPTEGTAIYNDKITDPDGIFNEDTGLDVSVHHYEPQAFFMLIEIRGGAAGQTGVTVRVQYSNGSYTTHTVNVAANETVMIEGIFKRILTTGTTAELIFPFF